MGSLWPKIALHDHVFALLHAKTLGMSTGDGKLWQNLGKLLGCRNAGLFWACFSEEGGFPPEDLTQIKVELGALLCPYWGEALVSCTPKCHGGVDFGAGSLSWCLQFPPALRGRRSACGALAAG